MLARSIAWLVAFIKIKPRCTYLVVDSSGLNLGDEDMVRSAGDSNSLRCDLTQDADGNTGAISLG